MAPNAQIIVAQFCSDPFAGGTSAAEYLAGQAVAAAGGGEVSNSFGYGGEFSGELGYDQYMTTSHAWSISPRLATRAWDLTIPAYRRTRSRRAARTSCATPTVNFNGVENCWNGSGGGISTMEALPNYQLIIGNKTGPHRGTPDYAAVADPNTGVGVYSTTGCNGWCQVGGTSVSSPVLAGIVNNAGKFVAHTASELHTSYNWYLNPALYHLYFFDVTAGSNGAPAGPGWSTVRRSSAPRRFFVGGSARSEVSYRLVVCFFALSS